MVVSYIGLWKILLEKGLQKQDLVEHAGLSSATVTKIAEKMKAYGLWETFVTDSFDEYIDNLVIGTESEIDEDDLFQEEFF